MAYLEVVLLLVGWSGSSASGLVTWFGQAPSKACLRGYVAGCCAPSCFVLPRLVSYCELLLGGPARARPPTRICFFVVRPNSIPWRRIADTTLPGGLTPQPRPLGIVARNRCVLVQ